MRISVCHLFRNPGENSGQRKPAVAICLRGIGSGFGSLTKPIVAIGFDLSRSFCATLTTVHLGASRWVIGLPDACVVIVAQMRGITVTVRKVSCPTLGSFFSIRGRVKHLVHFL